MKTKLKVIALTFAATTVFWCLAIAGFLWLAPGSTDRCIHLEAADRGFLTVMSARNIESQPVTFTVAEFQTNAASTDLLQNVLLERQLPPSGELWVGIKRTQTVRR